MPYTINVNAHRPLASASASCVCTTVLIFMTPGARTAMRSHMTPSKTQIEIAQRYSKPVAEPHYTCCSMPSTEGETSCSTSKSRRAVSTRPGLNTRDSPARMFGGSLGEFGDSCCVIGCSLVSHDDGGTQSECTTRAGSCASGDDRIKDGDAIFSRSASLE